MKNPVEDIKRMRILSANTIAIVSLKYLKEMAKRYGFGKRFFSACNELENARPTAVVLHKCVDTIKNKRKTKTIDELIEDLEHSYQLISKNALRVFPKKKKIFVLTHCHSTNVDNVLKEAKKHFDIEVFITETRPRDQGIITAKKLIKSRIKVHFIIDSAIGNFIKKIDFVLVGADALRKEGLVNKIGTYPLAVFARENKKPVYVAASIFKTDTRKNFVIEERPASEVTHKNLISAKTHNPAFDITPWRYVTSIVTEKGIYTPKQLIKLIR
jgi:ribose 1,5-bisphosphate isomerase